MLEERVEQWNRELTEKGWLEGLEQGRREGRSEGWREGRREARSQGETRLLRQMAHRFGPPPPGVE
jgi:flagellar biosynthesis/type III secretory pathway protein FliH